MARKQFQTKHSHFNEGPSLQNKCGCFDSDLEFYTRSFNRPKARVQFFDKKDGETIVRESRPKKKTWMPRSASADFYDPLHKANLCFVCYLNDSDGEQGELLKIRPIKLIYHLDDETISLNEPYMENSGHMQGRVFYRQKVPKYKEETVGLNYVTWKDLKVGEDINLFGKVYRLVSCDAFTKNFLHDRGIVMQDNDEGIPIDPWNHNRHFGPRFYAQAGQLNELQKLHIGEDTNLRSWEDMPKTLAFHVAWLDARNDFYGARLKRTFRMLVNTHDDSVTLTETTPGFNDALFLRNAQLPYVTIGFVHSF